MRTTRVAGLFGMVMLAAGVAAAQDTGSAAVLFVHVHVLDRAAIAPRDWTLAATVVETIYRKAGLTTIWAHDLPGIAADPRTDVTVIAITGDASRAAATSFDVPTNALAFVPGAAGNHGRLVYVFEDRIAALSSKSGIAYSALLGRVLAHEIGHVLLPFNSHSRTGIMRAALDSRSMHLEFFTDAQAAIIRARLAERTSMPGPQSAVGVCDNRERSQGTVDSAR